MVARETRVGGCFACPPRLSGRKSCAPGPLCRVVLHCSRVLFLVSSHHVSQYSAHYVVCVARFCGSVVNVSRETCTLIGVLVLILANQMVATKWWIALSGGCNCEDKGSMPASRSLPCPCAPVCSCPGDHVPLSGCTPMCLCPCVYRWPDWHVRDGPAWVARCLLSLCR